MMRDVKKFKTVKEGFARFEAFFKKHESYDTYMTIFRFRTKGERFGGAYDVEIINDSYDPDDKRYEVLIRNHKTGMGIIHGRSGIYDIVMGGSGSLADQLNSFIIQVWRPQRRHDKDNVIRFSNVSSVELGHD